MPIATANSSDDRDEVAEVLADRAPHRSPPLYLASAGRASAEVERILDPAASPRGRLTERPRGSRAGGRPPSRGSVRSRPMGRGRRPAGRFRFGSSWISQGWSGRCGGGVKPPSVGGAGRTFGPAPRDRRGRTGCCRRSGGSRPRGRERVLHLLDDSLVRVRRGSRDPGCATRRTGRARCSCTPTADGPHRAAASETRLKSARLGICARSTAAVPRSSAGLKSARSCAMNGTRASRVVGASATPGSASRANARSDGSDAVERLERGLGDAQRVPQERQRSRPARRPRARRTRRTC